jgi:hypothetical protein
MTYDPFRDEGLRRDVRPSDPVRPYDDRVGNVWVPLAFAVALLVGIGYFLLATPTNNSATPAFRADGGAVTKPEPSPN